MSSLAFSPFSFPAMPDARADERASIRGHAAGYAAGREHAERELESLRAELARENAAAAAADRAELDSALRALDRAASEFREAQAPVLRAADQALAAAAIELAETILGRELATGKTGARAALARALGSGDSMLSTIRMNPLDIDAIAWADYPGLSVVPDSSLVRGDAVAEGMHGSVDARIGTALARARAVLEGGAA
jgi:flagellar assembly protein FliH